MNTFKCDLKNCLAIVHIVQKECVEFYPEFYTPNKNQLKFYLKLFKIVGFTNLLSLIYT